MTVAIKDPKIWKNGKTLYSFNRLESSGMEVHSLFVSGNSVYAATSRYGQDWPEIWKNGRLLHKLQTEGFQRRGSANMVFVSGKDVYAAGWTMQQGTQELFGQTLPKMVNIATVWKNGQVLYQLGEGEATHVFVK
jgi:hypothetical protein